MARCIAGGGQIESALRDVERLIDGHPVRVLNLNVNVCTECGDVTLKWWTSFDEIDRMLRARLEREQFDAITWDDLISDLSSSGVSPS